MATRIQLLRYPFSQEAREVTRRIASDIPSLITFLSQDENEHIIRDGETRVLMALDQAQIQVPDNGDDRDVLVYLTARIIVEKICSQLPGKAASRLREYQAEAESKAVNAHLGDESNQFLMALCETSFEWNLNSLGGKTQRVRLPSYLQKFEFRIRYDNFLEVAPNFRSPEWKLVNRFVEDGWIYITRSELARLVSGKFKQLILDGTISVPELPERLTEAVQRIESELQETIRKTGPIEYTAKYESALPPCVAQMHEDTTTGKSLAHLARFALASFLLKIGMEEDQVLKVFSSTSDFKVRGGDIARYQIEHIAKRDYEAPSCTWMQRNILCPVYLGDIFDPLCEYVLHPLGFYETRKWELDNNIRSRSWYAGKRKRRQKLRTGR